MKKLGLVDNGIKRMDWKDVRGFLSIVRISGKINFDVIDELDKLTEFLPKLRVVPTLVLQDVCHSKLAKAVFKQHKI